MVQLTQRKAFHKGTIAIELSTEETIKQESQDNGSWTLSIHYLTDGENRNQSAGMYWQVTSLGEIPNVVSSFKDMILSNS